MIRTLVFAADATGKLRFEIVFGGFCQGGNRLLQQAQGQRSRDDRAKEAKILKGLKACADGKEIEGGRKNWALKPDGGTLVLDQKGHELLLKYVEAAPFPTELSDDLDDALDWIGAAPVEEKEK